MRKLLIPFISLMLTHNLFGQIESPFDKGFKAGFQEGYCYNSKTIDCLTPIPPLPPLPRLNEKRENYRDGYNRGFQVGLDLRRVSSDGSQDMPETLRFNQYYSQSPVDAMIKVGLYKQKVYDARVDWIRRRINELDDFNYNLLFKVSPSSYDYLTKQLNGFIEVNFQNKNLDFTNNHLFNQVVQYFNSHEKEIANTYKYLITYGN